MKKLVSLLSAFMLVATLTAPVFAEGKSDDISIVVDDRVITIADQKPVIVDDRVLVPARSVFEALGATVTWNANDRTVVVQSQDNRTVLTLTIDNKEVRKVYYESILSPEITTVSLDVPASIMNDRTMIPLRGVSENIDCNVDWDKETRTVIIDSKQYLDILSNVTVAEGKTAKESLADTLPKVSLSAEKKNKSVTVNVELSNADEYLGKRLSASSFGIKYDSSKFKYISSNVYVENNVVDAMLTVNPHYSQDELVALTIFDATKTNLFSNGKIISFKFESLTNEPGEFVLLSMRNSGLSLPAVYFKKDENGKKIDLESTWDIYADTTPITVE